jgi:hypothetical protein
MCASVWISSTGHSRLIRGWSRPLGGGGVRDYITVVGLVGVRQCDPIMQRKRIGDEDFVVVACKD